LAYFLAGGFVCIIALMALGFLISRQRAKAVQESTLEAEMASLEIETQERKSVPFGTLLRKLNWQAGAIFMCFAVTMFCPVFTAEILSTHPAETAPRILLPDAFVPLAFVVWNSGNLSGSIVALYFPSRYYTPSLLFRGSVLRLVLILLYFLCNRNGDNQMLGAGHDLFYMLVVQLPLGLTNGWLSSACMMGTSALVDTTEKEAAISFMGLCLVAGLTLGSVLSFIIIGGVK
jgi:solute carrier family 29 (equilibrative nucleoside transporter), member 1/2/3